MMATEKVCLDMKCCDNCDIHCVSEKNSVPHSIPHIWLFFSSNTASDFQSVASSCSWMFCFPSLFCAECLFHDINLLILTRSLTGQIVPGCHPKVLVLPRCQLVICFGASVRQSYMYWMTSILVSGTYITPTLIDEITRSVAVNVLNLFSNNGICSLVVKIFQWDNIEVLMWFIVSWYWARVSVLCSQRRGISGNHDRRRRHVTSDNTS